MIVNALGLHPIATARVGQTTPSVGNATGPVRGTSAVNPPDFAAMIGEAISQLSGQLRSAELASKEALTGRADTGEVVQKIITAEQTLQTSIAVRDKIVSAYLEISRMTI
jgi:flagellar hook-basal body complex protein FliE